MQGPTEIVIHVLLFLSLYFEVFMLITFLERRGEKIGTTKIQRYPRVAIVVPCYNEARTIAKTLSSLLALDYPKNKLELVVVNDGSTDTTWDIIERFTHYPQVRAFTKENGGKHTAVNFGIGKTDSDYIGCLDADSFVDRTALKEIIHAFQTHPEYSAIIPAIRVNKPANILQRIQHAEYSLSVFVRKVLSLLQANFITPGPFTIFKKGVFDEIGLYREAHNTEDCEMALRMQAHGMKIGNTPSAFVYTNTPRTYRALFKQRVRWTYGFLKNLADYKHMVFGKGFGTLGAFILPISFFSIFSAIFFTGFFFVSAASQMSEKYVQIQAIGFSAPSFTIDWFYFNTSSVVFITFVLIALTFALIVIGQRIVGDKRHATPDNFLFLFTYGFLAPWWLIKSVYDAARSRQGSWTSERN